MDPPSGDSGPTQQQFLNSVLSQRGPSALPYAEDTKWLIRQHLLALVSAYPSLHFKTATYTHNDGRTVTLLQADGTIPMPFQDKLYYIPAVIWLVETYPRLPPCVYVNPTHDMIIKRPHPYVDPSGLVSIPYLQGWLYSASNLVDLVRNLSAFFGRDPPLFSRSSDPHPNPNPNPRHENGQFEDPTEINKKNAINKVVEMVHGDMRVLRKTREAEIEGLYDAQAMLKQRSEQLAKGLKEMLDEKEGLEQQLQMVWMNSDVLEVWLREKEGKRTKDGLDDDAGVEVDHAFECVDVLSEQIMDCTASDLAIEDIVYSLEKAVQDGAIPFDQYLRNVRLLSRQQFFH